MRTITFLCGLLLAIGPSVTCAQDDPEPAAPTADGAHRFIRTVLTRGTGKVFISAGTRRESMRIASVVSTVCHTNVTFTNSDGASHSVEFDWEKITSTNPFEGKVTIYGPVKYSNGVIRQEALLVTEGDLAERLATAMDFLITKCNTLNEDGY